MSPLQSLLLRDAESLATRVSDVERVEVARALALGRQKVRAADALWSNGHLAEGLRLAREALVATLAAAPTVARVEGHDPRDLRALLARRGLGDAAIARVIAVRDDVSPLPARDAEVARAHAALYDRLQFARRDVDRALDPAARTPRAIRMARVGRVAGALVLAIAVALGIAIALRPREGVRAEASAQFGTGHTFAAANAIDGHPETEWLLPDGTSGSIDVHLWPPRRIERVVITNAHNPPYGDRAARDIRIEVSGAGRTLRSLEASFEALQSDPRPRSFEVGADGVDRVRVIVLSWHGVGGGLAEIALE